MFIVTADWHLREDTPICREPEEFHKAQIDKVEQVIALINKHKSPLVIAGDVFHHWKVSLEFLSKVMRVFKKSTQKIYVCYGNHDLPQHSFERKEKSGLNILEEAGLVTIAGAQFNQTPTEEHCIDIDGLKVLIHHVLTWDGVVLPFPGYEGKSAKELLQKYDFADVIVTGDNHQRFVVEDEGGLLINPGCLTRQTTVYKDFVPGVVSVYKEKVDFVPLQYQRGVVNDTHIKSKNEKTARFDSFLDKVNENESLDLNFKDNVNNYFRVNKESDAVKQLVLGALDNNI